MARKVTSVYIEFHPLTPTEFAFLREKIMEALKVTSVYAEDGIGLITWETGITNVPTSSESQFDWCPEQS